MITPELGQELITGLHNLLGDGLQSVILYGSVARGDDTPESDIDIAIITSSPISREQRAQLFPLLADLDLRYDVVINVVDIHSKQFEDWERTLPFYRNVREEGRVLWKAA